MEYYFVKGPNRVSNVVNKAIRAQITMNDLERAEKMAVAASEQTSQGGIGLEALTIGAVVSYANCFNSKYNYPIDPSIYDNSFVISSVQNEISEKMYHQLIMNYRNMHIAHSDNFLKTAAVGGFLELNEHSVMVVVASRVMHEDLNFYKCLLKLIYKAKLTAQKNLDSFTKDIKELLNNGIAELSNEKLIITPIPGNIDPLEMWGLKK